MREDGPCTERRWFLNSKGVRTPIQFDHPEFAEPQKWCEGRGVDLGCWIRSPQPDTLRVDRDDDVKPDVLADFNATLPFRDGAFDYAWASHTIEHIVDWQRFLAEMFRIARPGGRVILIVPDKRWTSFDPTHVNFWTYETFLATVVPTVPHRLLAEGWSQQNWSFYMVWERSPL